MPCLRRASDELRQLQRLRRGPLGWVTLQACPAEIRRGLVEVRGDCWHEGLVATQLVHKRRVRALELPRHVPRQQLQHGDSQAPDVAGGRDFVPGRFRRHVVGSATDGDVFVHAALLVLVGLHLLCVQARAEVTQFHAPVVAEEGVVRLQVAVHHFLRVQVHQALQDVAEVPADRV